MAHDAHDFDPPAHSDRLRRQAALAYLSRKALQASPSISLLGDVCRLAGRVLKVDHVHVVERLPDSHTLIARAAAGWSPERLAQWQMEVAPGSRLGQVLRTGGLMVLDDTTDALSAAGGGELMAAVRAQCGVVIGIGPGRGIRALFGIYSARRRRFTRDEIQFLRAVAPIVESALRREAEMTVDRTTRAQHLASQADLLRLVVARLRPALRQSVGHLWRFRTAPTDTFTFRRAVKMTERQVAEVADFIEDLSVLADLFEGRLPPRDSIMLAPMASSVVDQLHGRAASQDIVVRVDCDDDFIATSGDAAMLRRAVFNLLDNALRFTPRGGGVTIGISSPEGSTAAIVISDTGRGMTPAQIERLSHTRVDANDGEAGRPGLGWRLASAIVQAHGGILTAVSPGSDAGTTVTVRMPRLDLTDFNLPD